MSSLNASDADADSIASVERAEAVEAEAVEAEAVEAEAEDHAEDDEGLYHHAATLAALASSGGLDFRMSAAERAEAAEAEAENDEGLYNDAATLAALASSGGLNLHMSAASATGYLGVCRDEGRFQAAHRTKGGKRLYLGSFATAVEAAVCYARAVSSDEHPLPPRRPPPPRLDAATFAALPTRLGGLKLHMNAASETGYKGVYRCTGFYNRGRFQARARRRKVGKEHIGIFDTAVEAAEGYARAMLADGIAAEDERGEASPCLEGGVAAAEASSLEPTTTTCDVHEAWAVARDEVLGPPAKRPRVGSEP